MTPVSKQGHAQTPGTAPATTPTTHKRAESDAGLDDGEDLGASPGGPGRVLLAFCHALCLPGSAKTNGPHRSKETHSYDAATSTG